MTTSLLVECHDLRRTYPSGGGERVVLDGVSCQVPAGRLLALMGPSGSGKSTLLNIIGGLQEPTSGSVLVQGNDIVPLDAAQLTDYRARTVGFVFQEWNLIADLTVVENVSLPLRLAGMSRREASRRALQALAEVGLEGHAAKFPDSLSGGEQQRASIARAIVDDRPLILADEPTGSLDQHSGATVLQLLRQVVADGTRSCLVATHDPSVARACDEVWRIVDGRVVEVSRP